MIKPLYLFVGRSASGKSTIANILEEKHGYKQVSSYTTRPPRYEGESGHIFITEEEFNNLGELAAYTFYNNHHYGTTFEQLKECDIYVIDVPGVESLLKKLKDDNRPIVVLYFDADVRTRITRMLDRHDSDMSIISRLLVDEEFDWHQRLDSLVWKYYNIIGKNVRLYRVDANGSVDEVLEFVLNFMQYDEGELW